MEKEAVKQRTLFNTSVMTSTREMNKVIRPRLEAEAGLKRVVLEKKPDPQLPDETEIHFPDEDRLFCLKYVKRCPQCHSNAMLPCLDRRISIETNKPVYRVRCGDFRCGNSTEEFPTSQQAVAMWQALAILSK